MKNKLLLAALSLCACLFALPGVASAHVLKVDGTIGAVLHIEPDDNPTTGKPTTYALSFTDDTGRLDLTRCNCTVQVQLSGKTISSHAMQVTDTTDSISTYTFPSAGVYTMQFTGVPKTADLFQPFHLSYTVRVAGDHMAAQNFPPLLWIGMGMGIGLILLAGVATGYDEDSDGGKRET